MSTTSTTSLKLIRRFVFATAAVAVTSAFSSAVVHADIPLIGLNLPNASLLDGDFDRVKSTRHKMVPSPFWTMINVDGKGKNPICIDRGAMSGNGNQESVIQSRVLDHVAAYPKPIVGDVLRWRFAARSEHDCGAAVSLSLVFGDEVRVLTDKQLIPGGKADDAVFSGEYRFTEADADRGMPLLRARLHSDHGVRVRVDFIDVSIVDDDSAGPENLRAKSTGDAIELTWSGPNDDGSATYTIYRSRSPRSGFQKVQEGVRSPVWSDRALVRGANYYYGVSQTIGKKESSVSSVVTARCVDKVAPQSPVNIKAVALDAEVKLSWATQDTDVASYTILRGNADGSDMHEIVRQWQGTRYTDFAPAKGAANAYVFRATDFSGNQSVDSSPVLATVKTIPGASFRDLIKPMPITTRLSSDLWGAESVLPRDGENGIEHPDWSYWGGHPVKGRDGKYHLLVCRWPEDAVKGHWHWYYSTVVHAIADSPTGPYVPTGDTAFSWNDGQGHNPGLTALNDGTFMLHLRGGHVLTGASLNGPWQYEGVYSVDYNGFDKDPKHRTNPYVANIVGVQRADGSLLFLSKIGATMISNHGIMGPYVVTSRPVIYTDILPKLYQNVAYEDPALWRDEYQYHMIINGYLARRAIYLRSPDGIHWKFDPGTAYDPAVTRYEDGTRTSWYYLERPHVLQDEFGRATHFSLAVMDVIKAKDFGNDNHSSKNVMLPLTVHRRLKMLNTQPINKDTKRIEVLVLSEEGFDARTDMDLSTLKFGASEEVNFGRGANLIGTKPHAQGLVLEFDGAGNGITENNFVGKLIGRESDGELLVGFSKLAADDRENR